MNPQRVYDYLAQSRARVLAAVRPLGEEAWRRAFDIGPGTLARTLTHMMISEWYYIERMEQREVPPYEQWPIRDEDPPPFEALERRWAAQAERTRAAIGRVTDWDAPIEYEVTTDNGERQIVTCTASDLFTQLAIHEVHHRSQALNMLRHLGVELEDLDFNAMMYDRRAAES